VFVNTHPLHLHNFRAAGLSSDLATTVTLTLSRGRLTESVTRSGPVSDFIFYCRTDCFGFDCKRFAVYLGIEVYLCYSIGLNLVGNVLGNSHFEG
jgi:hypothetical protein